MNALFFILGLINYAQANMEVTDGMFVGRYLVTFGDSFTDDFSSFDTKRWRKMDRSLACLKRNCIYASEKQVQPMHGFIDMKLQKNCNDRKCCLMDFSNHNDVCTNYTGGVLLSVQQFSFGSFRFRAQPVLDGFTVIIGQHCVGITSGHPAYGSGSKAAVVAICHIHSTNQITLFSRYGEDFRTRIVPKFFKKSRQKHTYRIDWTETKLEFFVNGFLVGMIDFDEHVPNQVMYIFAQLAPDELHDWIPPQLADIEHASQMILHNFRYISYPNNKSMVIDDSSPHIKMIMMFIFVFLLVPLFFVYLFLCSNKVDMDHGYDKLLNQM